LAHDRWTAVNVEDQILVAAAVLLDGNTFRARAWFNSERLRLFEGATALQLVQCGRGDDVFQYLKSLKTGDII